jgi:hypothetical protein
MIVIQKSLIPTILSTLRSEGIPILSSQAAARIEIELHSYVYTSLPDAVQPRFSANKLEICAL